MIIKDKLGNETKYDWDTFMYDPFDPNTFLWLLEELDFPYLENEYMQILYKYIISERKYNPLARYIGLMKLCSFKYYHWKDSCYTKGARRYVFRYSPLVVETNEIVDYLNGGKLPIYKRVEPLYYDYPTENDNMPEVNIGR